MRTTINRLSEVPDHLQRIAKAALAVGMNIETYSVREEIVLYADGSFFSPDTHDTHALSLIHRGVESGFVTRKGFKHTVVETWHTELHVGCKIARHRASRDRNMHRHRALRLAIVDAFGEWYDREIA